MSRNFLFPEMENFNCTHLKKKMFFGRWGNFEELSNPDSCHGCPFKFRPLGTAVNCKVDNLTADNWESTVEKNI